MMSRTLRCYTNQEAALYSYPVPTLGHSSLCGFLTLTLLCAVDNVINSDLISANKRSHFSFHKTIWEEQLRPSLNDVLCLVLVCCQVRFALLQGYWNWKKPKWFPHVSSSLSDLWMLTHGVHFLVTNNCHLSLFSCVCARPALEKEENQ